MSAATDSTATDTAWASQALPEDFAISIDSRTKQVGADTLYGGSPPRALRLSNAGQEAFREIGGGTTRSRHARALGRKLIDDGLAHPSSNAATPKLDVTIVIPAHDRADLLEQTLAACGTAAPVVVVDDGSRDRQLLADTVQRHGARLVTRLSSGGPGAARTSGLAAVDTEFVAFLDSDCAPPKGWLQSLAGHFADPLVGAVAPRIVAADSLTRAGKYGQACGPLDLGDRPARVVPGTAVAYVPTAALVVRRAALDAVATGGAAFDPALRVGEDVDLVWRLHHHGWRVRFDPAVEVRHVEPDRWAAVLERRFRYGTSAAPLSTRHPEAVAPFVVHPWPAAVVTSILARRPALAAASFLGHLGALHSRLKGTGVGPLDVARAGATGVTQTWRGARQILHPAGKPSSGRRVVEAGRPRELTVGGAGSYRIARVRPCSGRVPEEAASAQSRLIRGGLCGRRHRVRRRRVGGLRRAQDPRACNAPTT